MAGSTACGEEGSERECDEAVNQDRHEISVSLRDLVAFVLRGALFAVVLAGLAASGAYVLSSRETPVYRAEAILLVARGTAGFTQFGLSTVTAPPIDLGAYRVAVTSDVVLEDALRRMGEAEPTATQVRSLRSRISSAAETGARDSSLFRVEGRGETAQWAVLRANAVAEALVAWDRRRAVESVDRVIATLTQQIEALSEQVRALQAIGDEASQSQIDGLVRLRAEQQQQLAYARALGASAEGLLSVLQRSDATARQVSPRPLMNAAVAGALAVVFAYALLLLRVALNTRLRGSEDIANVTGLTILAEFPTVGRNEGARLREASSYLRTNLLFVTEDAHPRVFMITSAVEHEGKSTVARHLAEGFVRFGYRTLLVDADLRAPSLIEAYDVGERVPTGATTEAWLSASTEPRQVLTVALEGEGTLDLLPQPRRVANAAELLGRGFRSALARLQQYDVIVIDTPPVLAVADPLTIAPHCTGTILVTDRQRSDRRKVADAVASLQRIGVQVLGVVANNVGPLGSGAYGGAYGASPKRRAS